MGRSNQAPCGAFIDKPTNQIGKLLILLISSIVIWATIANQRMISLAIDQLLRTGWGSLFVGLGIFFLIVNGAALVWRLVLFFQYRPIPPCSEGLLPLITAVVPAYNEGRQVLLTLRSLAESDYPIEKVQIIAVDDGSIDDTWNWICEAERQLPGRVTAIRLPLNKGKRHALFAGFQESKGQVLITVDSDSIVEPQTLRMLVSPFVNDRRVGAVAGNVRVLNRTEGMIPRMLDVIFFYSFDFLRASQSMVHTVMCTPGALSAYLAPVVIRILPEWIGQTFCGRPANIGEDRAMTNLILREGYHVLFQQNAVVYTNVPVRYKNLCRMFLRWARSNIRETLVMSSFAFRKFRDGSMLGARINLLLQWLVLSKSQLLLIGTLVCLTLNPVIYAHQVLLGIIITSGLQAGLYCWRNRNSEGIWAFLYGLFWFVALSWITPYALLTPQKTGWLTRRAQDIRPPLSGGAGFIYT